MPERPSFDTWTILFLAAALHGLVLAVIIWQKGRGSQRSNRLLSLLIALFAISLSYYVAFWTGYSFVFIWMNGWVSALPFAFGPLMLAYVVQEDRGRYPKHFRWHFLPFIVYTIFLLPILIRNMAGNIPFLVEHYFRPFRLQITAANYVFIVLQCMSLLFYSIWLFMYTSGDRRKLNSYSIPEERIKNSWLIRLTIFFTVFSLSYCSYWLLVWTGVLRLSWDYMISASMSLFIYAIGYMGFRTPVIWQTHGQADVEPVSTVKQLQHSNKYRNSSLDVEEIKDIWVRLNDLLRTQKPYLENTLKIQDLSTALEISTHHLSQVINTSSGSNYADLINRYRIDEACRLLSDPDYDDKILTLAFEVGYSNKSTFHVAFKKQVGCTPADYRRQKIHRGVA
ncbi:MAG: AraC family transcriptional regulator [Chitinophagales bacterium]